MDLNRYNPLAQQDRDELHHIADQRPHTPNVRETMDAADQQLAHITALATALQPLPDLCAAVNRMINLHEKALEAHQKVIEALTGTQADDLEESITLGQNIPLQRLDYHGRRHIRVWVPGTQSIIVQKDGIGFETIALTAGWTTLDPPRRAMISAAATPPFTIVLRYTDNVPPQ